MLLLVSNTAESLALHLLINNSVSLDKRAVCFLPSSTINKSTRAALGFHVPHPHDHHLVNNKCWTIPSLQ